MNRTRSPVHGMGLGVTMAEYLMRLWGMLCCTASDHVLAECGPGVNVIQTHWLAEWQYLTVTNVHVPESPDSQLAAAKVCDELRFVVRGDKVQEGDIRYRRVPVEQLMGAGSAARQEHQIFQFKVSTSSRMSRQP